MATVPFFSPKKAAEKIGEKRGIERGKKAGLKEGEKIGIEKGAKNKALEMAKTLNENGVDISLIVKSSELKKEEIEKL